MRIAILADIHANAPALQAVLKDIDGRGGVDELWCLGDIVGHGVASHHCLEILRQYKCVAISGNNDLAVLAQTRLTAIDSHTTKAISCTVSQLTSEDILFLAGLLPLVVKDGFTLVHASPRQPSREYVSSQLVARENFSFFTTPYCLVGHTHIPVAYKKESATVSKVPLFDGSELALGDLPMIINPGSVGQPRDKDLRASYAIYDSRMVVFCLHRVPYDITSAHKCAMEREQPIFAASRPEQGA